MKLKQGETYTIKTEHGEIKNMPQKRKMRYIGSVKAVCGELKVFESCRGGYRETYTAVQWKDCVCHTLDGECVQGEIKVAGEETKRKPVNSQVLTGNEYAYMRPGFLSTAETACFSGWSRNGVSLACAQGRVHGAMKENGAWIIPRSSARAMKEYKENPTRRRVGDKNEAKIYC